METTHMFAVTFKCCSHCLTWDRWHKAHSPNAHALQCPRCFRVKHGDSIIGEYMELRRMRDHMINDAAELTALRHARDELKVDVLPVLADNPGGAEGAQAEYVRDVLEAHGVWE